MTPKDITGILAGLCIGGALVSLMWHEPWNWRTYIRYQIAAVGIVLAIYLLR